MGCSLNKYKLVNQKTFVIRSNLKFLGFKNFAILDETIYNTDTRVPYVYCTFINKLITCTYIHTMSNTKHKWLNI